MQARTEDRLASVAAFIAVARRLSFAEAGRELGLDASTLSRRVSRLEQRLGARLLQRTTRKVALTEAGVLYLEHAADALGRLDDAEAAVSRLGKTPRGLLRIALPSLFGQRHIAPILPGFMKQYPELRLELSFSDRFIDLLDANMDVAVRIGALDLGGGEGLVGRRLAPNRRLLCAAPSYLEAHGEPRKPEELSRHWCLHFTPLSAGGTWHLFRGGREAQVRINPTVRADNAEALRLAALGGCGIALLATFVVGDDLKTGRLVHVLPEWTLPENWIWIAYPSARLLPRKVRVFVDYLVRHFQGEPPWSG